MPAGVEPSGRQSLPARARLARHLHVGAYVAVVLEGSYWEAHAGGRTELRAGDMALHGPYSAHANHVGARGALVLNCPVDGVAADSFARVEDLDAIVRAANEGDPAVGRFALAAATAVSPAIDDWPDQLAAEMAANPRLCIGDWALKHGLAPETVSRGFRRVYGATPKQVRGEHRARRALAALLNDSTPLAALSLDAGFPDQASMTRAVRWLTGASPLQLRRQSSGDKTAGR
jgi:AraC-like DNA-binding protein